MLVVIITLVWAVWPTDNAYLTVPDDQPNTIIEGAALRPMTPTEADQARYLRREFDYLTKVWVWLMQHQNQHFLPPKLVFFINDIKVLCSYTPEMIPDGVTATITTFYCPTNGTLYVDLGVDSLLQDYTRETAQVARLYVLARAIGYYVQQEQGTLERLVEQRDALNRPRREALEARRRLQLDCYAGLWLHFRRRAEQAPSSWPIDDGIRATWATYEQLAAILPKTLWQPETLTHATDSLQRRWFDFGLEKGVEHACDSYKSLKPSLY